MWLKEEIFYLNNSSFVFLAYLNESKGIVHIHACVSHGFASMCTVLFAREPAARAQSSNLSSSSLGHLLAGLHWEQDGRLDSKSIHPHRSFFPPSLPYTILSCLHLLHFFSTRFSTCYAILVLFNSVCVLTCWVYITVL